MSQQRRIVKNTGILMGMELAIRILEVLVSVILARYLAPQGYGLMAFALAFVSLFSVLPGFGMGTLVTRDLARDTSALNSYLANGILAKALLSLLALVAIAAVSWALGFPLEKGSIVFLAGLLMVMESMLWFTSAFFRAAQRMSAVAFLNMGMHGGWLIVTLAVVALKGGLITILAGRALISLSVVAVSLALIHFRLERISWNFSRAFSWHLLKRSLPFALFQLFVRVYVKVDIVMLSLMRGDVMTGWYFAAQKFRQALSFIPSSVSGATMPAMSKFSRDSGRDLLETLTKSCKYLMMIALPIAAGVCVTADRLISVLYGSAYQEAVPALRIVIWTILFSFMNSALSSVLLANDHEKQMGWALAAGAVFNLLSNFLAIPLWGHVGAATTTVLSEALVLSIQLNLLRKVLPEARPLAQGIKPMAAALTMMVFAWFGRGMELVYTVAGCAVIYVGSLIAFKALNRDEWSLLAAAIPFAGVPRTK